MTLNEIYIAILNNQFVYWSNKGYKVILDNHALHVIFIDNGHMTRLQPSELSQCFIGE